MPPFFVGNGFGLEPIHKQMSGGERSERCQCQMKRGERVTAVEIL